MSSWRPFCLRHTDVPPLVCDRLYIYKCCNCEKESKIYDLELCLCFKITTVLNTLSYCTEQIPSLPSQQGTLCVIKLLWDSSVIPVSVQIILEYFCQEGIFIRVCEACCESLTNIFWFNNSCSWTVWWFLKSHTINKFQRQTDDHIRTTLTITTTGLIGKK